MGLRVGARAPGDVHRVHTRIVDDYEIFASYDGGVIVQRIIVIRTGRAASTSMAKIKLEA